MLQLNAGYPPERSRQGRFDLVIVDRIRGEFREMPGLTLTLAQASRLWSLDDPTCQKVMGQLVESGFLCRRADGAFVRGN